MKTIKQYAQITAIFAIASSAWYIVGYSQGKKSRLTLDNWGDSITHSTEEEWRPKVGDRIATVLQSNGRIGDLIVATITNMSRFGSPPHNLVIFTDRLPGLVVYGDALPGVDSSWVKPAP